MIKFETKWVYCSKNRHSLWPDVPGWTTYLYTSLTHKFWILNTFNTIQNLKDGIHEELRSNDNGRTCTLVTPF